MAEETRRLPRVELYKPISPMLRWRGKSGEHDACIKDVTLEGCFLNTQGKAEIGETITFKTSLPNDDLVELRGRVVHHQARPVGFGVRFEEVTDIQRTYLKLLIADADDSVS